MIDARRSNWIVGTAMAVILHVALAAALLWQPPPRGVAAAGGTGVRIGLAPAGALGEPSGASGPEAETEEQVQEPPAKEVAETAEADTAEPEAVPDEAPEVAVSETVEPIVPDPAVPDPVVPEPAEVALPEFTESVPAQAPQEVAELVAEQQLARRTGIADPELAALPEPSIEPVVLHEIEKKVQEITAEQRTERRPGVSDPELTALPKAAIEPVILPEPEPEEPEPDEPEKPEAAPPEPTEVAAVVPPPLPPKRPTRPVEARPVEQQPARDEPAQPVETATRDHAEESAESGQKVGEAGRDEGGAGPSRPEGQGQLADSSGTAGGASSGAPTSGDARGGSGNQGSIGSPGERADYLTELQLWLERHKKYPRKAQRRRQEGTAKLFLIMSRDGNVLDYRIEESSGHRMLDREVKAMLLRAQPLPTMPDFMPGMSLELVVPVVFSLR